MAERLDEIKARANAATPGPWMWEGNTDARHMSLATKYWGRWVVMGFRRWGMQGAQPMFAQGRKPGPVEDRKGSWGPFTNGEPGQLTEAEHLARYEVCPTATSRKDQRVYRADLNGIRNADATFIEKSREDVDWLLSEVERLRGLLDALETQQADHECATNCTLDHYEEGLDDRPTGQQYPCALGVFCDKCATTINADILVSDLDDKATRFGYIRAHAIKHGWSCDNRGDFCPDCKPGAAPKVVTVELPEVVQA